MLRRQSSVLFFFLAPLFGWVVGCAPPQYPNCQNDSHCHQGEFCVNGSCQQCRSSSDCPRGRQCQGGFCERIPGWCESDADCPSGQVCRNNQCETPVVAETPIEAPVQQCQLSSVYFAYDSSELDSSARAGLQTNAQCIQSRDIPRVRATGHADPRGTEEYNLALGDRRARAAQGFLGNLGVDRSRVEIRSVGEEMARGTDESSWAQDRRVELEERR